MDDEALAKFAAYCRTKGITFVLRRRGPAFSIEFSAEHDEDVEELLKYLRGETDDKAPEQQLLD
jgi:hypothetical protein